MNKLGQAFFNNHFFQMPNLILKFIYFEKNY
jgi:hypothetical protein